MWVRIVIGFCNCVFEKYTKEIYLQLDVGSATFVDFYGKTTTIPNSIFSKIAKRITTEEKKRKGKKNFRVAKLN